MLQTFAMSRDIDDETRTAHIGILVTPSVLAEIERIMKDEDRSKSHVGYALLLKGLEAYHKDGHLTSIRNLPFKKGKPNKT